MLNSVTRLIFVILVTFNRSVVADLDHSKCPQFDIKERTIIKAHDSEANGAKFLGRSIVSSSRGCYKKCCEKDDCNLVSLKFEDKRVTCFMFDCGSPSKCLFRTHLTYRNYATVVLEDREIGDSLYDSNPSQENDAEKTTQEVQTTTPQPLFHRNRNEEKNVQPDPIVSNTKKPWKWYDKVTTVAPHRNFGDTRYDHTKSNVAGDWLDKVKKISTKDHVTTSSPDDVWQPRNNKKTNHLGYKGSKYTFDHGQDVSSEHKKSHVATTKAQVEYKATDENDSEEEESFPRRVFVDNNPSFPDPPSQPKAPKVTNPPTKVYTKKPITTKKTTTKKKHTTESSYHNVIIKRFNIQENKAVIPLAVGLVLALLLLMAVVFRLKTSRRRRTKAFLTDDADYLINGMYL